MSSISVPIVPPVADFAELAEKVSSGRMAADVLRQKRGDVLTARARVGDDTVIVKLWNRPGMKGLVRRFTWTHAAYREWRALSVLWGAGVHVPNPLHYRRLSGRDRRHTDAVIMQDLGASVRCSERLTALLRADATAEADALTSAVVDLTAAMIHSGVLDLDHTLMNFIVPDDGVPRRVDLELARCVVRPAAHDRLVGAMLGRLTASYVFCVQPWGERVEAFAQALGSRTNASCRALRVARECVEAAVRVSRARGGAIAPFHLAW